MHSYQLPDFPSDVSCVHAALYTDVTDSDSLRKRLIAASTAEGSDGERERDAVNFAFIEARLSQNNLRTKTVHSEIIWALNPSNNVIATLRITEAMRRYGVSDSTTALVVVRVCGPQLLAEDVERGMDAIVHGNKVSFALLKDTTDWSAVKKYHKLGNEAGVRSLQGDPERERVAIDGIVVSSVAMKSVMG
ncbi:kinase binding protein CGI-121-domain-containing protein [Favolaschia claudopus]|uniref:EKC/KEOPS complex subunit CGI121 n=1 Tax=Favolaschia claudopus TaxID=2862362 RepID=A0AAW0DB20_9AGAR